MSRRQPTQVRGFATQRALVEGAARAFDISGYNVTSLSDISAETGISSGAMYFHFKSKMQIALAVMREQHDRSYRAIAEALDETDQPLWQMMLVTRRVADQILTDPVVRAGIRLALDTTTLREPAAESYERWSAGASGLVKAAIDEGLLDEHINPDELGRVLIATFTGTQLMSQTTTGGDDLYNSLAAMWRVLIEGCVAPEHRSAAHEFSRQVFKIN